MTPQEIEKRDFFVGLRGYDRDEVDAFLAQVATEHGALLDEVEMLRAGDPSASDDPIADIGASVTAILRTANEQAEQITEQAKEQADVIRREADEHLGRVRAEATQIVEAAREEAARMIREAQDAVERVSADAERRGHERALERADVEVARLADASRRHEELRARLSEACDELSLALMAMGEPAGDAFVAVRDVILTEALAEAAEVAAPAHEH